MRGGKEAWFLHDMANPQKAKARRGTRISDFTTVAHTSLATLKLNKKEGGHQLA